MHVTDLGEVSGPVLAFGGALSNAHALSALLDVARDRGIATSHIVSTGDVLGYCGEPIRTMALIREAGVATIAGNVEKNLAAGLDDCGCGFDAGTVCDRLSAGWYGYLNAAVDNDDRDWMAGLPDIITLSQNGRKMAVIHGGVTDISRFLWPDSPEVDFADEVAALRKISGAISVVVSGHCGVPFMRNIDGVRWVNAGVIGMPPHDGNGHTRYAILDGDKTEICRLDYDARSASAAMQRAGLTQGYNQTLLSGWWPSEDTLPGVLRRSDLAVR